MKLVNALSVSQFRNDINTLSYHPITELQAQVLLKKVLPIEDCYITSPDLVRCLNCNYELLLEHTQKQLEIDKEEFFLFFLYKGKSLVNAVSFPLDFKFQWFIVAAYNRAKFIDSVLNMLLRGL